MSAIFGPVFGVSTRPALQHLTQEVFSETPPAEEPGIEPPVQPILPSGPAFSRKWIWMSAAIGAVLLLALGSWYGSTRAIDFLALELGLSKRIPGLQNNPSQIEPQEGAIILQTHTGTVWFRHIRIKRLTATDAGEEARTGDWPAKVGVIAGYRDNFSRTAPVGSFAPNKNGLFDLGGNVWEWIADYYRKDMNSPRARNQIAWVNDDGGGLKYRALRGASWFNDADWPNVLTATFHHRHAPDSRDFRVGFRVVREVETAR